MAHNLASITRL